LAANGIGLGAKSVNERRFRRPLPVGHALDITARLSPDEKCG